MNVSLYATKLQAQVMAAREEIERAYDRYPDPTMFWCFVDLIESSNYRIAHGPKEGYVRAETFFAVIDGVTALAPDVRLVKEIGDSVFLCSLHIRSIFESVVLIEQTVAQMAAVAGTPSYPFGVRCGIGFGAAKRLKRRYEDFVGTPIDQLSRLMGIRSATTNILMHEDAYQPSVQDILREYRAFLTISDQRMASGEQTKGMLRPLYYRELVIDRGALAEFRDHFIPWR